MLNSNSTIKNLLEPPGASERILVVRKEYLTDYQKELLEYRRCYDGQLFDEIARRYPWGQQMDSSGRDIERREWKPRFIPDVAKELAQTLASYLTGKDKFPSITLTSTEPLFEGLETDPQAEDTVSAAERAQSLALNTFVRDLLEMTDFQTKVALALEKSLVNEEQPVLIRFYGGRLWLTMPERVWCDWEYSEEDPTRVSVFKERWFFKRPGVKDKDGKDVIFIFRRTIDDKMWIEEEIPIIVDEHGNEKPGTPEILFEKPHGFDFCPFGLLPGIDESSIYAGVALGNIKGYIESYNDVHCGTYDNMKPQWVTLTKSGEPSLAAGADGEDDEPLVRGRLWSLNADSIQSFANQVAGYEIGEKINNTERADIRRAAHVVDIPADTELSGRAIELLFGPQYAYIDRWRGAVEKSLKDLVIKILQAAVAHLSRLVIGPGTPRPGPIKAESIIVTLDWGQMLPVTPESIGLELDNVTRAVDAGLMSKKRAQEYTLPLFGVEDVEGERAQLAQEKEERDQADLMLADAAFNLRREEYNG